MPDEDAQADSIDIELRSPGTVARRCLVLATIVRRFSLDAMPRDDAVGAAFDLREWLRTEDLWNDATEDEKAFFMRPPANPVPDNGLDAALAAESLATIAWTLGLLPSLSEDHLDNLAPLLDEVPSPWEPVISWLAAQAMRPEAEIARMRERQEIWHWRYEIEPDRRSAKGRALVEVETAINAVTEEAIAAELLASGRDGGFARGRVAVTAMTPDEIAEQQLLTQERLLALNWVCGFGNDWDSVPQDV